MNFLTSVKALWVNRKAVKTGAAVLKQVSNIPHSYKTWEFWVAFLGNLIAFLGTIKLKIDPQIGVMVMGGLTAAYSVMRGVKKSQDVADRPLWKSSEFILSVGQELAKMFLAFQVEGIDPALMSKMSAVVVAATGLAAKLGEQDPTDPKLMAESQTK
jgi:hypothetical protein